MRPKKEKKSTSDALQTAKDQYRELFHGIPVGLYQTTPDGKFLEVNQAMVDMFGYPDAETLKKVPTRELYVHETHYNLWKKISSELGRVRGLEVEMWKYDRTPIWVEIHGKSVKQDGRLLFNEGSVLDISARVHAVQELQKTASKAAQLAKRNAELYAQVQKYNKHLESQIKERTRDLEAEIETRKKSEHALRESEARYKSVVDRVREAICKIDCDGEILFLNPAWSNITGFDVESSLGKNICDFFSGRGMKQIEGCLAQICTGELQHCQLQLPLKSARNEKKWVEFFFDAELDLEGTITGVFVLLYDITDQKKASDEIKKAYAKEKELNELRTQFVSMTSHEFRTPLATILTSSELLQHYSHRWPEEKVNTHHERIQTSVHQIISMMDDILIIGRSDAGKLECIRELNDPADQINKLIEEVVLNAHFSHNIDLTVVGEPHECYLDRKLFRQIVSNVLTNSIKYSEPGSSIGVQLAYIGGSIRIIVKDQGIGIPEQDLKQMFQAFYRARNVGDRHGTGLGLSIVKRSVDAHNGSIEIDSKENMGTTVSIILDVTQPAVYEP